MDANHCRLRIKYLETKFKEQAVLLISSTGTVLDLLIRQLLILFRITAQLEFRKNKSRYIHVYSLDAQNTFVRFVRES